MRSGFGGCNTSPESDYFNGLENRLKGKDETLFPTGAARYLRQTGKRGLADAIDTENFRPGADRYLRDIRWADSTAASPIGRNLHGLSDPGRIASLTSIIGTLHRGSPVVDLSVVQSRIGLQFLTIYESVPSCFSGRSLSIFIGARSAT